MQKWVRAGSALVLLVALVIGVPWLLITVAGWPLPTAVPDWGGVVTRFRQGNIESTVVIKSIATIVWLAWLQLMLAVFWEAAVNVPRLLNGRRQRPAPLVASPVSHGVARLFSTILAVGVLTATQSQPVVALATSSVDLTMPAPATLDVDAHEEGSTVAGNAAETAAPSVWVVRADDTLWDIAEKSLGDGSHVTQILDLNPHLMATRSLRPGTAVSLPAGARMDRATENISSDTPAADVASPEQFPPPTDPGTSTPSEADHVVRYTVGDNDGMWNVAEALLGDGTRHAELQERLVGQEVAPGVVFDADTFVIHPGWVFTHPDHVAPAAVPDAGQSAPSVHVVAPGDSLSEIAEQRLGDADGWREIFDENRGDTMVDAWGGERTFDDPDLILPGWSLDIPITTAAGGASGDAADVAGIPDESPSDPQETSAPDRSRDVDRTADLAADGETTPLAPDEDSAPDRPGTSERPADPADDGETTVPTSTGDDGGSRTDGEGAPADQAGDDERVPAPSTTSGDDDARAGSRGERQARADARADRVGNAERVPASSPPASADPDDRDENRAGEPARGDAAEATTVPARPSEPGDAAEATSPPPVTRAPDTTTTTTMPPPGGPAVDLGAGEGPASAPNAPSPIRLEHAALLAAGVLSLVGVRRLQRLRGATPRARIPIPPQQVAATERRLRTVDPGEGAARLDIALRAAGRHLAETGAQIGTVRLGTDGHITLRLTAPGRLPAPWAGLGRDWVLPATVPMELLADDARRAGPPCHALAHVGIDTEQRNVLIDLEAAGVLAIEAGDEHTDEIVRAVATGLASSSQSEVAHLVTASLDADCLLGHPNAHRLGSADAALDMAATLAGSTVTSDRTSFDLRALRTGGEMWEPAVVMFTTADDNASHVTASASPDPGKGLAVVTPARPGELGGSGARLVAYPDRWELIGFGERTAISPIGLSVDDVEQICAVLDDAEAPIEVDDSAPAERTIGTDDTPFTPLPHEIVVGLLGGVEVRSREGESGTFERSKTVELIAWLATHRDRSTRSAARTALWDMDVRDATFANVVSEARRALGRLVAPPDGEEWVARTLNESLPLHDLVVTDADLVEHRLDHARLAAPSQAIEVLRPAVELIRDLPFAGTSYLWPDADGIMSNLVLLATTVTAELAAHALSIGDIDTVFWATGHGLRVLPGHEECIALRMKAHARAGDLAGVRQEWESYERVIVADSWSDGEPAPKLLDLRRELLSPGS